MRLKRLISFLQLLLAGLAATITAYMLYKASKDKEKKHQIQAQPNNLGYYAPPPAQSSHQSSGSDHKWGKLGAAAALLGGGAGIAAYSAHNNSGGSPAYEVPWSALKDWKVSLESLRLITS